jgi:cell division initiation protein
MSKPEELALTTTEPRPRITSPERNITITPLDMRQARFSTALRGFDKDDVTTFLQEAAEGFDHAMRENERLRMEIVRLEASLNQYREMEGGLKSTLMSAQKIADDMRETAQKEAERLIREAEGRVPEPFLDGAGVRGMCDAEQRSRRPARIRIVQAGRADVELSDRRHR